MTERLVPRFAGRNIERSANREQFFPYTRSTDGSLRGPDTIKQGGEVVLRHVPESHRDCEAGGLASFLEFYRIIMYGLNRAERQLWVAMLDGKSTGDVSRSLHVSRAAVLARIRGNKGQGGMIRKNVFVLAWWLAGKNKVNQYK